MIKMFSAASIAISDFLYAHIKQYKSALSVFGPTNLRDAAML